MNKSNVVINSIRHACQLRDRGYFNSVVSRAAELLNFESKTINTQLVKPATWKEIKEVTDTVSDPVEVIMIVSDIVKKL